MAMDSTVFYPRELWQHSPVYNTFVKLFANDIHALQHLRSEGAKDSTRFWLNHPIRWVQVIGIIVALVQKENADTVLRIAFIPSSDLVDDSSGATIELVISKEEHRRKMPDVEYDERQERLWKRRRKPGHMDVGTLIKVKGEIQEKWNIRKINVMKLDIVTDQNVETKAWEERVLFKRDVLSKPWRLPSSILLEHHKPITETKTIATEVSVDRKPEVCKIDFQTLPPYAHSIRNLKLLLLSHVNTLQRFTPAELLALEEIHYASMCVARHDLPKGITERDVTNILLATLNLLLRDGNIIIPKASQNTTCINASSTMSIEETFVVVGRWNLSSTIKSIAKRDGKIVVRDVWKKIVSWGNGWEGTTKGVIGVVVEEVLTGIEGQEWAETKAGVWTRLDI